MTNYAIINLQDQLARVKGVSRVQVFGGQYALRVWVEPDKLAKLGVTAHRGDLRNSDAEQRESRGTDRRRAHTARGSSSLTLCARRDAWSSPEEFGNIILRANPDGPILHLSDVARVELGDQAYGVSARYNQAPSGVMAIYQLPGSNAVETAAAVTQRMKELSATFPPSITYSIPLDTTKAVTAGIHEILVSHCLEALGLVVIVVYHLSSGLARHAHSIAGGAGLTDRNLHHFSGARFLDQHAFAVRPGAGHRPGG